MPASDRVDDVTVAIGDGVPACAGGRQSPSATAAAHL